MDNRIGCGFESLAHRMAYWYAAGTMPNFAPVDSPEADLLSQRQLYRFLCDVAQGIQDDPAGIGLSAQQDEAYDDWELRNHRVELSAAMSAMRKKLDEFYMLLLNIGRFGQVREGAMHIDADDLKLTPKALQRLCRCGIRAVANKTGAVLYSNAYPALFPAWKLLAALALRDNPLAEHIVSRVSNAYPLLALSHCLLNRTHPHSCDIFTRLSQSPDALQRLARELTRRGYPYIDIRENELSMDWALHYGNQPEPLKASWGERGHGGFSVTFDWSRHNQLIYGLRVPRYRELLANFNQMDGALQDFILRTGKHCDGCGYCTQTDKTGNRPRQMSMVRDGRQLCRLYPGFSYRWTRLDDQIVDDCLRLLDFADRLLRTQSL